MIELTRRRCLLAAAVQIASCGSAHARNAHQFCRFSITDGWGDSGPQHYIARQATRRDPSGIPQVVEEIEEVLGFTGDFQILIAEQEDNAFATVANGRRILGVDVDFLERLNQLTGTRWSAIQVIAHEVGHHIDGFSGGHIGELNADYWSGQTLYKLGSSRVAAIAAISTIGSENDTRSHPNKHRRAAIIGRGWDDAALGEIDYQFCRNCR